MPDPKTALKAAVEAQRKMLEGIERVKRELEEERKKKESKPA